MQWGNVSTNCRLHLRTNKGVNSPARAGGGGTDVVFFLVKEVREGTINGTKGLMVNDDEAVIG